MAKDVLEDFIVLGGELACREREPAKKELRAIKASWKQLKSAGKVPSRVSKQQQVQGFAVCCDFSNGFSLYAS